jgi:hypothetical protein
MAAPSLKMGFSQRPDCGLDVYFEDEPNLPENRRAGRRWKDCAFVCPERKIALSVISRAKRFCGSLVAKGAAFLLTARGKHWSHRGRAPHGTSCASV